MASSDFPATDRNRRFLAFVVEKTLTGAPEEASGYNVATQVFGRPPEFNPTTDPIVRIEAAKLRRDLEVYYLRSGQNDPVKINLPRGGYIPVFQRAQPRSRIAFAELDPCGITVGALHDGEGRLAQLRPSLQARVADRLARETGLAVFSGPSHDGNSGLLDSDAARELGRRNGTRFILSGDLRDQGDSLLVTARLHDGATGRLVWSEDFAGDPAVLDGSIARRVAERQRELLREETDGRRVAAALA